MVKKLYIFLLFSIIPLSTYTMLLEEIDQAEERQDQLDYELCKAVFEKNIADIEKALQEGANPNTISPVNWPILSHAADFNAIDMAKILLTAGADVNKLNPDATTILSKAVGIDNVSLVTLFIQAGANVNAQVKYPWDDNENLRNKYTKTALMRAVCRGNLYAHAKFRYESTQIDAMVQHYYRDRIKIGIEDNIVIIKELLKAGADLDCTDYDDKTAFDYAKGNDAIEKLLRKEQLRRTRSQRMHWFCMGKKCPESIIFKLPKEIMQLIHKQLKSIEEAEIS